MRTGPLGRHGGNSMTDDNAVQRKLLLLELVSGLGQVAVAIVGVACWSLIARAGAAWFLAGAALWVVAVALKLVCAHTAGLAATVFLQKRLPYFGFVAAGGIYTGVQSSFFEMGLTLLAVWKWPALGQDMGRAVAVGVGAGAIEAVLLGAPGAIAVLKALATKQNARPAPPPKTPSGAPASPVQVSPEATAPRLFWLIGTVERVIALLCHASSRALLLLGMTHGDYGMVWWGVGLFTVLDGFAGALTLSGKIGAISVWWIELMLTPFAFVSIWILIWCFHKYGL